MKNAAVASCLLIWISTSSGTAAFAQNFDGSPSDSTGRSVPAHGTGRIARVSNSENASQTKLFGGIEALRLRGRATWLQQQQPQLDPSTRQSVIELVQRKAAQAKLTLPASTLTLPPPSACLPLPSGTLELPSAAALPAPSSHKLLPLPEAPESPLFDDAQMRTQSSEFALKCRASWSEMNLNYARANKRLDDALLDLRQRSLLNMESLPNPQPRPGMFGTESHDKLEKMMSDCQDDMARLKAEQDQRIAEQQALMSKSPRVTNSSPFRDDTEELDLSWDKWYAGLVSAVKQPLLDAVNKRGNPAGRNTVLITVWPDLRIEIEVQKGDNPDFDAAVLDAYHSLNFDPVLEFPNGSKRKSVSFLSDHKHLEQGAAVDIDAHKLLGDVEHQSIKK